ncbi:MAG: macro domain-containing protein [Myxococcales bacterium]|nr:macro domain-containing protein [Myxococcales bacterium]
MIETTRGDILKADAEALVNTVNCVGVMGRGIAAQFKRVYPRNFTVYQHACKRGEVQPGRMLIVETGQIERPRWVINFPTKRHWRGGSRIEDIDAGLTALVADVRRLGIQSIAVPPLGCGLGGLDWAVVRPRIEDAFAALPGVAVLLFEPDGAPLAKEMVSSATAPAMTPGRAVLVGLIERYLAGLMDPFVSLLEIHKLMYFMQEAGEPLRLRYAKAHYGPYAQNLGHVLSHVEGHFLTGYADGGDAPGKRLELVPGASKNALAFLEAHPDTKARFDRVAGLVQGFESPFGMELLATVHWVAAHDGARTVDEAIDAVYQWNDRKRAFEPRQIQVAWDVLGAGGWLGAESVAAQMRP